MPCTSGLEGPPTPEELKRRQEYYIREREEKVRNTAAILEIVLGIIHEPVPDNVKSIKDVEHPSVEEADYVTSTLCSILKDPSPSLIKDVNNHPKGPQIGAWWEEHLINDSKHQNQ
jgi:hypothetical protein